VVERDDGTFLLDGLLPIDELKDLFDIADLPEEDKIGYQTLGGFIMSQVGHIPATGQHFEFDGITFEVVDMDGHRVDKVLVTPAPKPDAEPHTQE